MKKRYAQNNPQCRKCKYCKPLAADTVHFCDYVGVTGKVPGYLDEDGRYHRQTDPCPEFTPGTPHKYTPEDWMHRFPVERAAIRKDYDV